MNRRFSCCIVSRFTGIRGNIRFFSFFCGDLRRRHAAGYILRGEDIASARRKLNIQPSVARAYFFSAQETDISRVFGCNIDSRILIRIVDCDDQTAAAKCKLCGRKAQFPIVIRTEILEAGMNPAECADQPGAGILLIVFRVILKMYAGTQ